MTHACPARLCPLIAAQAAAIRHVNQAIGETDAD